MKKALICGISGQDGAYLAKLLITKIMIMFRKVNEAGTLKTIVEIKNLEP